MALILAATATVAPPSMTFQAVAERSRIDPGDRLPVTIVILNNSERELRLVEMLELSEVYRVDDARPLPPVIAPFGSHQARILLRPKTNAGYGKRDALLMLRYRWNGATVSALTATVTADVKRPFEDEASGLPGGTAALFTLLLPLFPAFFAYQIVDRWRKGEGFQVPTFNKDYVFPAFFIGILASSLGLRWSRSAVLVGAAVLGAAWPLARWAWELHQRNRWAFAPTDSDAEYLRKLLLGPRAPHQFRLVKGQLLGEAWSGIRLQQPDGDLVLGSTMQITPVNMTVEDAEILVKSINEGGDRETRKRLLRFLKSGTCKLSRWNSVQQGGRNWRGIVAAKEIEGLEEQTIERADLLKVST